VLGRDDLDRRVLINTIGPVWDGNEGVAARSRWRHFRGLPELVCDAVQRLLPPLFLILAALIFRGVAFEFRAKRMLPAWRLAWDHAIFWGSLIPALLWGVAFANILRGVPIGANFSYLGSFFNLLNPYSLLGGSRHCFCSPSTRGLRFLRTTDDLKARASQAAKVLAPAATAAIVPSWRGPT